MPEIGTEIGVRLVYSLFVHKRDRASIFGGRSMVTSARIVCMLPFKRGEAFFFFLQTCRFSCFVSWYAIAIQCDGVSEDN